MKKWLYMPGRLIATSQAGDWWVVNGHWSLRLITQPEPNGSGAKVACISPGHESEWIETSVYILEVEEFEHISFERCEELVKRIYG